MLKNFVTAALLFGMSTVALSEVEVIGPESVNMDEYYVYSQDSNTDIEVTFTGSSETGCYKGRDIRIDKVRDGLYLVEVEHLMVPMMVCAFEELRTFELKKSVHLEGGRYSTSAKFLVKSDEALEVTTRETKFDNSHEAIVEEAYVNFVNGGINPHMAALQIELKVKLGNNSCHAMGKKAEIKVEKDQEGIHAIAMVSISEVNPAMRYCTMEYNPVYKTVTKEIRYNSMNLRGKVFIDNYQSMDNDVNALDFLRLR